MSEKFDADALVRALNEAQFGHLPHRDCTAADPMQPEDMDRYRWHHLDAKILGPYLNLIKCKCPHCGLTFTCLPRPA